MRSVADSSRGGARCLAVLSQDGGNRVSAIERQMDGMLPYAERGEA